MSPAHRNDGEVSAIGRAAVLLKEFRKGDGALGIAELTRRTGLPKSTVHRTVHELVRVGLLEQAGNAFRVGLLPFELGQTAPRANGLVEAARPHMVNPHDATGHNVALAVLEETEVVYVEIFRGDRGRRLPQRVGGRWPAHAGCAGKVMLALSPADKVRGVLGGVLPRLTDRTITDPPALLAELAQIRRSGVAFDRQESIAGVVGAAAPVQDGDGAVLGALAISGPVGRISLARVDTAVRAGALGISRDLARGASVVRPVLGLGR
ncbi:IclR family transcriptional regulator [Acrocarpospora sp. B8E8]|uniref:IclR family transcriptional regulator n=1 Tax=Acrocarpospora sp. B8E8 TaxID=3153572 RepID=UPI00325F8862